MFAEHNFSMAPGPAILSPIFSNLDFDNFLPSVEQPEPVESNPVDIAATTQSHEFMPGVYNPSEYSFDDWADLASLEYILPSPLSLLQYQQESPMTSDSSSLEEDSLEMESDINDDCFNLDSHHTAFCKPGSPASPDFQRYDSSLWESNHSTGEQHVLTSAQTQELYNIAMPSLSSSSASSPSASSPETKVEEKSQSRMQRNQHNKQQQPAVSHSRKAKPFNDRRKSHNLIEKKYRISLNNKIAALRDCIPSLHEDNVQAEIDCDEKSFHRKGQNKGLILSSAIEYIAHLEKEKEKLNKKCAWTQSRITDLEKNIFGMKISYKPTRQLGLNTKFS